MTLRETAQHIYNTILVDQEDGETEEATVLLLMDTLDRFAIAVERRPLHGQAFATVENQETERKETQSCP